MDLPPVIALDAFADSRFARQLRDGFRWLRFPRDLEQDYQQFHLRRIRNRVRAFFAIWPLLEIYRVIDGTLTGVDDVVSAWTLLNVLCMAAGAALLWSRGYWRLYLPITTVLAAALVAIVAYSIPLEHVGNSEMQTLKFALNVPLVTHLLLGLPWHRATIINVLGTALFAAAATQVPQATPELFSGIGFVVLVVAMACLLAYTAERSERTHFLQERLLGEIASRDGLTGLQNRAALDAHLERVWSHALRSQEPVGLLLLDVDHFKGFNDSLGHQAGDACLRQVADVLKAHAKRPFDLAARYGGEEFAIVLFQTPPDQVRTIADAVRAAIEALDVANPASPRGVVTVSCGVAIVTPVAGRSVHGLIQFADEALYEAKESGRNAVRLAEHYVTLATGRFRRAHLRAVK